MGEREKKNNETESRGEREKTKMKKERRGEREKEKMKKRAGASAPRNVLRANDFAQGASYFAPPFIKTREPLKAF